MAVSIPTATSQWELESPQGISSLHLKHDIPIPPLKPNEVLVAIHACSLNARDSQIVNNTYMWGSTANAVPLSDCAGVVIAVGDDSSEAPPSPTSSPSPSRLTVGTRVCATFHRHWQSGALRHSQTSAIGALEPGVLRQFAVFARDELVEFPERLSFAQAATLPCAAVTAWNALFGGNASRTLRPGEVVLTQGSGGVSLFAIQIARAAGGSVIATTGQLGGPREEKLRELGASHVLSYRDGDWGEQAKALTPGGRGVDFVVEVSGAAEQSAKALRVGGTINVIGGFAGSGGSLWDIRLFVGDVRRIAVGSRSDFEDMNRAIEANGIEPVVDTRVFDFENAQAAYEHMESGKAWGKVVIQVAE